MDPTEALIAAKLADGPLYVRSFQKVKPVVDRMVARGALRRVAPRGGRNRNMVELAPPDDALPEIDRLAEALANGASISAAARHIGVSQSQATVLFRQIKAGLGAQAV